MAESTGWPGVWGMPAIPDCALGGRAWLIGQESWFVLGYQFAAATNTGQYRLWLRKSFTDEMLEQWRRTSLCKDLPPDWQSTLAYELRRRGLRPCTGCPTLIRGKRWAQPQGTELCAGCAARRLAEEVGRGPGRG